MRMYHVTWLSSLLFACTGPKGDTSDTSPDVSPLLVEAGPLNPFPSRALVGEDGQLGFSPGLLPTATDGDDWEVERLNLREGFSRVQPSVAMFLDALDPATVGDQEQIGTDGAVRMVDLDTGEPILCFAELDAHPDALEEGRRALLVRPMQVMEPGHEIAVVVRTAVHTEEGAPLSAAAWQARVAAGEDVELDRRLAELGVSDVAWAWSFPVADGTAGMRAVAAVQTVPSTYTFERTWDVDEDALPPATWRRAEGSFQAPGWLVDDVAWALGADGLPEPQADTDAYLFVHVPTSVRGAAPGSVPVLIFGHGILSNPGDYLAEADDPSHVVDVAERLGVIVVATTWRGLTTDDLVHAVATSNNFGRFHEITDMLGQGVSNTLALSRLVREGPLLDDPLFGGLADRSRVWYYGISLGAIEGMVTLSNQDVIEHAVLHVGGSDWSTMLERSSDWPAFEQGVTRTMPDPWDRQVAYATSQLFWDAVDPASYVDDLRGRGFLWHESIGDQQVPNITSELLYRSAGVPLGQPAVTSPVGIDTLALPAPAPVFVQFDPQLGLPDPVNRPATNMGAHEAPRTWEGTTLQTVHYFTSGGEVQHYCGEAACAADNTGG